MMNIFIDNLIINLFKLRVKYISINFIKKPEPKDIYHK